jgi:uncharacterized protein
MDQRINFLSLGVADLERSAAFYEALGWTAASYGAGQGVVFFQMNGIVFGLYPLDDLAALTGLPAAPASGFRGVTMSYNTGSPAEVDAIVAQVIAAGGRLLAAAAPAAWGGYLAVFADPDGHAWEVYHNPTWAIREDGSVQLPH